LKSVIHRGDPLHILFVNDLGFQFGAGLAELRQIQSMLLMDQEVSALCWAQGPEGDVPFFSCHNTGTWRGMKELGHVHANNGCSEHEILDCLLSEVRSIDPDVVIVGNLHGAKWPIRLVHALSRELDSLVVAYMHDCYMVTGRCAYPGGCILYERGCDCTCPTPDEYPALDPSLIQSEWELRRKIFCGSNGVPLVANSRWTLGCAERSMNDLHHGTVIYLGIDTDLFRPVDQSFARGLLGLPRDRFIVLSGAVNVSENRKGGHLFREVFNSLSGEVEFVVFGLESGGLEGVHASGLVRDYRKMPLLYSVADLFVGTALEEAFGMTLVESAACQVPAVAFNVGGVAEAGVSAKFASGISSDALLKEIRFFMNNEEARKEYGLRGRQQVEEVFSLKAQGNRWIKYFRQICIEE